MHRTDAKDECPGFQNDIPGTDAIIQEERSPEEKPGAEDEPAAKEIVIGEIC
ncbi:hypothetical protein [Methanocalculus taiwanensis]|uniref:hypothetical protein n=1 Tax=Methanocalculus taiwanensis TaxID=106207 RepID=UPI0021011CD9|nr:hypothetical protein [Methanocalculus taiwanensis]